MAGQFNSTTWGVTQAAGCGPRMDRSFWGQYWPPFDLVIIPRLGGAARIIGQAPSVGHSCWSPDGKRIATPSRSGFQLIDVSTGASKEIAVGLPRGHSLNGVFDWSAQSDLLLVRTLTPATGGSALWTVRPDGSGWRQILEDKDIWSARWDPYERAVSYFIGRMRKLARSYGPGSSLRAKVRRLRP